MLALLPVIYFRLKIDDVFIDAFSLFHLKSDVICRDLLRFAALSLSILLMMKSFHENGNIRRTAGDVFDSFENLVNR